MWQLNISRFLVAQCTPFFLTNLPLKKVKPRRTRLKISRGEVTSSSNHPTLGKLCMVTHHHLFFVDSNQRLSQVSSSCGQCFDLEFLQSSQLSFEGGDQGGLPEKWRQQRHELCTTHRRFTYSSHISILPVDSTACQL